MATFYYIIKLVLFSPSLASYSPIILARRVYLERFLPLVKGIEPVDALLYSDSWMPYTLHTRFKEELGGSRFHFVHCFLGKYLSSDFQTGVMNLTDKKENVYSFGLPLVTDEDNQLVKKLKIYLSINKERDQALRYKQDLISVNTSGEEVPVIPIDSGDILRLCWDDERTLSTILRERRLDPSTKMNINDADLYQITKYVQN